MVAADAVTTVITLAGTGSSLVGMVVREASLLVTGSNNSIVDCSVIGSAADGIVLEGTDNLVTGATAVGNGRNGALVTGDRNRLISSLFGVSSDKSNSETGNQASGLVVGGANVLVDDCTASGNIEGITVQGDDIVVQNSRFGTTVDGLNAAGNTGRGAQVDGSNALFSNVIISGNLGDGIRVFGANFLLEDSIIGADATFSKGLGNTHGVTLVFGAIGSKLVRSRFAASRSYNAQLLSPDTAMEVRVHTTVAPLIILELYCRNSRGA